MTGTIQSKCFIQSQCVYATLKIVYDIESWLFFAETLARLGLSLAPTPSNSSAGSSKSSGSSAHFVCKVLRKSLGQTGRNSLRSKSDNCLHRLAGSPSPSPGTNTAKTCLAVVTDGQCDQIGQFIVIWETFLSLWHFTGHAVRGPSPVLPDIGIKSSPIIFQSCQVGAFCNCYKM